MSIEKPKKERKQLVEDLDDEPEDVSIRAIITDNILTLVTSFILLILAIGFTQYSLIKNLYDIAFNFDSSFYYYEAASQLSGIIQSILMGFIQIGLNYIIGTVRFILLIIIAVCLIYCLIHFCSNLLINHNIRYKYLILTNFIAFITTITIVYFTMPKSLDILNDLLGFIQMLFDNGIGSLAILFDIIHYLYYPIFLSMFLMFFIDTGLQLLFKTKWAKVKKIDR